MPKQTRIIRWRNRRHRRRHQQQTQIRRLLSGLLMLALSGFVSLLIIGLLGGAIVAQAYAQPLPPYAQLATIPRANAPTRIYAQNNTLIYEIRDPLLNQTSWTPYEQLPSTLIEATIATVDPTFWQDDPTHWQAWWQGEEQGLTVQLVQSQLQPRNRLEAWLLTRRVTNEYTPEQILTWYLNTRHFGDLAVGAETAVSLYFNQPLADLTLPQATFLLASSATSNPFDHYEQVKTQQQHLLDTMFNNGAIDAETRTNAQLAPIQQPIRLVGRNDVIAPHYALQVQQELIKRFGGERVLRGGLQVFTTLDLTLQQQADCLAQAQANNGILPADERAQCVALPFWSGTTGATGETAVLTLNPQTGQITSLVGSLTYPAPNQTQQAHPIGRSAYPFIYLTALSQGYNAATMILDIPTNFGTSPSNPIMPQNPDGQFRGPIHLRQALTQQATVPAMQVLRWVGEGKVRQTAVNMNTIPQTGTSILSETVTLTGLAQSFAILSQQGVGTDTLTTLQRVESPNGDLLYEHAPQTREILSPELAYLLGDILQQESLITYDTPHWAMSATPQQVVAIWSESPTAAASIRQAFVAWLRQDAPPMTWPRPSNLIDLSVCYPSGLLPTPYCPTVDELFIAGTQPTTPDTLYREIAINSETGRRATIYTPPDLIEERIFQILPPEAQAWGVEQGIPYPPTDYDTVDLPTGLSGLSISQPSLFGYGSGQLEIIGTVDVPDLAYYRLAYFPGLTPTDLQLIADEIRGTKQNEQLATWDVSELDGLYTILLTAILEDGRFLELSTHLTIDNQPPTARVEVSSSGRDYALTAFATDDVGLAEVTFFVDGRGVPFARDDTPPYEVEWQAFADTCYTFHVVATDLAGNQRTSTAVSACDE